MTREILTRYPECQLLADLFEFFEQRKSDKSFYVEGLFLIDIGKYDGTVLYNRRLTPKNTVTFACTLGDDVHFGLLSLGGRLSDSSPVVMTAPMSNSSSEGSNVIVGESLREFLCLGCGNGFSNLEEVTYPPSDGALAKIGTAPSLDRSLNLLRETFNLSPWKDIKSRLQELNQRYRPFLEFEE